MRGSGSPSAELTRALRKGPLEGTAQELCPARRRSPALVRSACSLSEHGAAERLTHQTKTAGFPALLYDGGSSDNPRFRVLVGPQSSSDAAQRSRAARPPLVPGRNFCPLHRMKASI